MNFRLFTDVTPFIPADNDALMIYIGLHRNNTKEVSVIVKSYRAEL